MTEEINDIPEQYSKIQYLPEDEGLFEASFSELLQDEIIVKRKYKSIEIDEEDNLPKTTFETITKPITGIITHQSTIMSGADVSKRLTNEGNYMQGSLMLITTAVLYFDTPDSVNDIVIFEGKQYNVVNKFVFKKPIPHIEYMLKLADNSDD